MTDSAFLSCKTAHLSIALPLEFVGLPSLKVLDFPASLLCYGALRRTCLHHVNLEDAFLEPAQPPWGKLAAVGTLSIRGPLNISISRRRGIHFLTSGRCKDGRPVNWFKVALRRAARRPAYPWKISLRGRVRRPCRSRRNQATTTRCFATTPDHRLRGKFSMEYCMAACCSNASNFEPIHRRRRARPDVHLNDPSREYIT